MLETGKLSVRSCSRDISFSFDFVVFDVQGGYLMEILVSEKPVQMLDAEFVPVPGSLVRFRVAFEVQIGHL